MKKLLLTIISVIVMFSCASGRYISLSDPQAEFTATEILYNEYPELVKYYEEGVLKITSLREVNERDNIRYKIKYKFVKKYYYDYAERMECLKTHFPELYTLYTNGVIEITSLYKYVDDYGVIRHHASYRRLYDFYYDYHPYVYPYGGYRYYYVPRYRYAPRPQYRPQPKPQPRPSNPPATRPNPQPNRGTPSNPPRGNGGGSRRR